MSAATTREYWRSAVRFHLGRGLGIDDIALLLKCSRRVVEAEIAVMRRTGMILQIVRPDLADKQAKP